MRPLRAAIVAVVAMCVLGASATYASATWEQGSFVSGGKPVDEFHCAPSGAGSFPAVIILHGAGPRNMASDDLEDVCTKLADHGYYGEFLEYFSQTDGVGPSDLDAMVRDFPTWLSEVRSGIAMLRKNPSVGSNGKIALMGYSLGGYISLTYGATYPEDVSAIVEYYGGLPPALASRASTIPPVLIIHGDFDRIVPVQQARDLDALLTKADRPHEMKIYPGAQHGFNFPDAMFAYKPSFANDAWDRSLKFLDTYLHSAPQLH